MPVFHELIGQNPDVFRNHYINPNEVTRVWSEDTNDPSTNTNIATTDTSSTGFAFVESFDDVVAALVVTQDPDEAMPVLTEILTSSTRPVWVNPHNVIHVQPYPGGSGTLLSHLPLSTIHVSEGFGYTLALTAVNE